MGRKIPPKVRSMILVSVGATGLFTALNVYSGNEKFYDKFLMPLVHKLSPETSHRFAVLASKYGLVPKCTYKDTQPLGTVVWELAFSNPVGMAAGFDKQGEAVPGLHKMGFGFVEVGSVTPLPQEGNQKPRVFRLEQDQAIINRYGFNSEGHDVVYSRIKDLKSRQGFTGVVGVNLGKNRTSPDPANDYVQGIKKFGDVADYLVINVSSPNTPGLRAWQGRHQLEQLLALLVATRNNLPGGRKPPLLLKLAPDLGQQERKDIAQVIALDKCRVDGLVISNTTVTRGAGLTGPHVDEQGGLSGRPLTDLSTQLISDMYTLTQGKVPIVGVGGVFSGQDAYEKIAAGASLVQLYTALAYHGPPVVARVKRELDQIVKDNGYRSVADAVGTRPKT